MALVQCPDCGKMVSPRVEACPFCGCPAKYFVDENEEKTSSDIVEERSGKSKTTDTDAKKVLAMYVDDVFDIENMISLME